MSSPPVESESEEPSGSLAEPSVAIVGVGLIGGSIAAALKHRGYTGPVIGVGRNLERVEGARAAGLVDEVTTHPPRASLVVYCSPVNRIAAQISEHCERFEPGTLVTDAGSVKANIRDALGALPDGVEYIGSHPLAGSEKAGFEHSDPDLFENRVCVITPDEWSTPESTERLERFWSFLGSRVSRMEVEDHDRILAMTSHVPHVAAAVLAGALAGSERPFAATGFRDTTRIAAGDPGIWVPILLANRDAILDGLLRTARRFEQFQRAIEHGDALALERLLSQGKLIRDSMDEGAEG